MKAGIGTQICMFVSAWFVLSAAAGGCACVVRTYNVSRPEPVYVKTMPPSPKEESVPAKPSASHVWVKGAWQWNDGTGAWEWKPGAWTVPPAHYVWVDATYEQQGSDAVVYTPGHWEEAKKAPLTDKAPHRKQQAPSEKSASTTSSGGLVDKSDHAAEKPVQNTNP